MFDTKDVIIRVIKIVDIGYITCLYFFLAFFFSVFVNRYGHQFNEEEEKNKPDHHVVKEIIIHATVIGVVMYILRNVVELFPFPLDGWYGFEHKKVKELGSGGPIAGFLLLFFQDNLKKKLEKFKARMEERLRKL